MTDYDLEGDYASGFKHIRHIATERYVGVTVDTTPRGGFVVTTKNNGCTRKYEIVGPEFATEEEAFAFAVTLAKFD